MPVLIISTRQGATHEVEVRNFHDANREIDRFNRQYLANHPNDAIVDMSVVSHGNIIARYFNGRLEDF